MKINIYSELQKINHKPKPFEFYTTPELWNDEYISKQMLEFHLNESCDIASRNKDLVNKSIDWLISKFNINSSTRICDFGCGPGLYTTKFAQTGAAITGIDLSKRSIEYAKNKAAQENLQIEYVLQNYLDFTTNKKFDLITMIFCDFCVLSEPQRKILLTKFYDSLAPDGHIVFDVFSLAFFAASIEANSYSYVEKEGFWSPNLHYVFQNNFKYEDEQLLLHKYTIFEQKKFSQSYNWLQCYSIDTITKILSEVGFKVIESYSDVAGTPLHQGATEITIVAKKV